MLRWMRAVLLLFAPDTARCQINTAIAVMRASEGQNLMVEGTVTFSQAADDPLGNVTVVVDIKNLPVGEHGFHVHQYGDTRNTSDLSTMSAHFVPYCTPPDIIDGTDVQDKAGCKDDQVHGLPPDLRRQPGDMGNIEVGINGQVQQTITLGQQKLSLTDRLKSIVGRTVVVHRDPDDGTPPYGNAGPPVAYGIIGIARPADGGSTNGALAPRIPTVDQVICTFERAPIGKPEARISGFALLTLQQPDRPDVVRMQAVLDGFSASSQHSFHFHNWGDMSVDFTQLGMIYRSEGIEVHELHVNSKGQGVYDAEYDSNSLLQHVGRALTVHEGPDRSTPTIAAAACGLSYPGARLDTSKPKSSEPISPGVVAVLSISIIAVVLVGGIFVLYAFKLPIPLCGSCIYGPARDFIEVPPPPPKGTAIPPGPPGGLSEVRTTATAQEKV